MKTFIVTLILISSTFCLADSLTCSDSMTEFTYNFKSYAYGTPPHSGQPRLSSDLVISMKGKTIVTQKTFDNGDASGTTTLIQIDFDDSARKLIEGDPKLPVNARLPSGTKRTYSTKVSYKTLDTPPQTGSYNLICDEVASRPVP